LERLISLKIYPVKCVIYRECNDSHIRTPIYKGRFFESEDFEESDEIPLVVGYAYKDIFEIGQTFTVTDESLEWQELIK